MTPRSPSLGGALGAAAAWVVLITVLQTVTLTLRFERAGEMTIRADVR